jgi:hypothetical protein
MTDVWKQPNSGVNLAEAISRRFAPHGGVDDLAPHPPVTVGDPSWRAFDQSLAEARSNFADMSQADLAALIADAVAAVRAAKSTAQASGRAVAPEP